MQTGTSTRGFSNGVLGQNNHSYASLMERSKVPDENIERILQLHCNTPFFKDNPYYLHLWERYFALHSRDPRILFFMRHKHISRNYQFLYVELSKYFESRRQVDVSVSLLRKAISANVYKKDVLVKELRRLGKPPNLLSDDDVERKLEPKSLFFWGKEWIFREKKVTYDRESFIVNGEEISFEEMKSLNYARKCGSEENKCNTDAEICNRESHTIAIAVGAELVLGNEVFHVREQLGADKFSVMGLGNLHEEANTIVPSYHTLQIARFDASVFDRFVPTDVVLWGDVMVFRQYKLGLLGTFPHLCNELLAFFFLRVLEVVVHYHRKNVFFNDLSLDDFFVNDDFSVVLCNFAVNKDAGWDYAVLRSLKFDDADSYMDKDLEDAYEALDARLAHADMGLVFLKLKMLILEKSK